MSDTRYAIRRGVIMNERGPIPWLRYQYIVLRLTPHALAASAKLRCSSTNVLLLLLALFQPSRKWLGCNRAGR